MKLYREVKASDRLPDLAGMSYTAINKFGAWVSTQYAGNGKWTYEFEYLTDGYVEYWLEPFDITEDELNNIIQPHAITLEHGEKAVKEIIEYLQGKE